MGLRPKFTKLDISKFVGERLVNMEQVIVDRFINIGLQFVRDARIKADFKDRTGNLRSSIGFLVLKDGAVVREDFEQSKVGTDKQTGINRGLEFAQQIPELEKGVSLVVVAGMQYAVYVEAMGYDVLTGSSLEAENNLREAITFLERISK